MDDITVVVARVAEEELKVPRPQPPAEEGAPGENGAVPGADAQAAAAGGPEGGHAAAGGEAAA